MRVALFVVVFILIAAATVRYVVSRASSAADASHSDGIQEVE
jgi:hypothetical protein